MKRRIGLFSTCLALSLLSASPLAASERRAVIDGAILSIDLGKTIRRLTLDGPDGRLPRFSPDGRQVALIAGGSDPGDLLIYSLENNRLRQLPLDPDRNPVGMRFVEKLVWFGPTRIAVSGSVNPSLTETLIFDLVRGRVVDRIFSDAHGVSLSADGTSFAYFDGMPHFAPREGWRPTLKVNHRTVYRFTAKGVRIAGPARFLKHGQGLAVPLASDNRASSLLTLTRSGEGWSSQITRPARTHNAGQPPANGEPTDEFLSTVWTDNR